MNKPKICSSCLNCPDYKNGECEGWIKPCWETKKEWEEKGKVL
jgi:hypothetical protein